MRRNCCNDCINCEMLIRDENLVIIVQNGLDSERIIKRAVKCGRFGQYATSVENLPKSDIVDDFIYK